MWGFLWSIYFFLYAAVSRKRQHLGNPYLVEKGKKSSSDQWNCTYDFPFQCLGKTPTSLYRQCFFGTGTHIWLSLACLQVHALSSMCVSKVSCTGAQVKGTAIPPARPQQGRHSSMKESFRDFNFIHSCFEIKLIHSQLATEKKQCFRACNTQCWSQPLSKKSWFYSRVHIIQVWEHWNSCYLCN